MKTIFFDLDGTLVDSLSSITEAVNLTRLSFQLPPMTESQVCACVGWGSRSLVEKITPEPLWDEFMTEYLIQLHHQTPHLYPGIIQLLSELRDTSQYRLIVASNKPEETLQKVVADLGISSYFDEVRGVGKYSPKPNADMLYCDQPGIMVGDSEIDVETSKNAKIPCIAVTYGFRTREQLIGAQLIIDNVNQIKAAIESILQNTD